MSTVWIVHRDPRTRSALARLVGDEANLVLGGPQDRLFDSVGGAETVLLGLRGELEPELAFAHRFAGRHPGARWLLVPENLSLPDVRRVFDTLDAEVLPYPPAPAVLRRQLRAALEPPLPESLSARRRREALTSRFSLWLGDLKLPALARALDPAMAGISLLVRGERGTGRGLLAGFVHAESDSGHLARVSCEDIASASNLESALAPALEGAGARRVTLCIAEVDALPPGAQSALCRFVEDGLPPRLDSGAVVRWLATAGEPGPEDRLSEELARALAGIDLRIPPLRERGDAARRMGVEMAAGWGRRHLGRPRRLEEAALDALAEHPWPGNTRELEAVVTRSLAASPHDPLRLGDLRFDGIEEPWAAPETPTALPPRPEPQETQPEPQAAAPEPEPAMPEPEAAELPEAASPRSSGEPAVFPPSPEPPPHAPAPEPPRPEPEPAAEFQDELLDDSEDLEDDLGEDFPAEILLDPHRAEFLHDETDAQAPPAAAPRAPAPPPPERGLPPSGDSRADESPLVMDEVDVRRLVGAIAHEVRNPLVTVRTFTELLPERFDDPEFRSRYHEVVGADVRRIERAADQLSRLAGLAPPERESVDLSFVLESALGDLGAEIQRRDLTVLKEIDHERSQVLGDPEQLRFAVDALLTKALDALPQAGSIYLASRRHPSSSHAPATVRVLFRFRGQQGNPSSTVEGLSFSETALEITVAEAIVRMHGGSMTVNPHDPRETLVLIDLPAA